MISARKKTCQSLLPWFDHSRANIFTRKYLDSSGWILFMSTIKVNLSIARNHRQSNGEITPGGLFFCDCFWKSSYFKHLGLLIIGCQTSHNQSPCQSHHCVSQNNGVLEFILFPTKKYKKIQKVRHLGGFWGLPNFETWWHGFWKFTDSSILNYWLWHLTHSVVTSLKWLIMI